MYVIEQSSRRRIFSVYTGAKPFFGVLMVVPGVILMLAVNAAAGGLMTVLGLVLFFLCASVWEFDKQQGIAQRGLRWLGLSLALWQCTLGEISAVEVKEVEGVPENVYRTALVLKDGQRRSLWTEYPDRSRDLARFLSVKLVEQKAKQ